jgi:hypothetical protein
MSSGDLNVQLLIRIMDLLGGLRADPTRVPKTTNLLDLLTGTLAKDRKNDILFLHQHLLFLEGRGLVTLSGRLCHVGICDIRLTAQGAIFVQPELAEFGSRRIFPEVVEALERQILTYPEEPRSRFLFEFRDAIAKNRAELIAKLLVEVLPKVIGSAT